MYVLEGLKIAAQTRGITEEMIDREVLKARWKILFLPYPFPPSNAFGTRILYGKKDASKGTEKGAAAQEE